MSEVAPFTVIPTKVVGAILWRAAPHENYRSYRLVCRQWHQSMKWIEKIAINRHYSRLLERVEPGLDRWRRDYFLETEAKDFFQDLKERNMVLTRIGQSASRTNLYRRTLPMLRLFAIDYSEPLCSWRSAQTIALRAGLAGALSWGAGRLLCSSGLISPEEDGSIFSPKLLLAALGIGLVTSFAVPSILQRTYEHQLDWLESEIPRPESGEVETCSFRLLARMDIQKLVDQGRFTDQVLASKALLYQHVWRAAKSLKERPLLEQQFEEHPILGELHERYLLWTYLHLFNKLQHQLEARFPADFDEQKFICEMLNIEYGRYRKRLIDEDPMAFAQFLPFFLRGEI